MKEGMVLEPMVREVLRRAESARDMIAPCRDLAYATVGDSNAGMLRIGGRGGRGGPDEFTMSKYARSQLADVCGIPGKYFETCRVQQPRLLDDNVNTWLGAKEKDEYMIRTLDGNVRAVLSNSYRRVDNYEVLQYLMPEIEKLNAQYGVRYESVNLSDEKMYIKLVTDRLRCEVDVGDVVQGGVVISNSEVGAGSVSVAPLVFRLRCSNGLILADEGIKRNHVGRKTAISQFSETILSAETVRADNAALLLTVRDVMKHCLSLSELEKYAGMMRRTMGMRMEAEPVSAVKVLANRFDMSEDEKNGIIQSLMRGSQMTGFGLLNAVTDHSKYVGDYDRSTELEAVGGKMLRMSDAEWRSVLQAK